MFRGCCSLSIRFRGSLNGGLANEGLRHLSAIVHDCLQCHHFTTKVPFALCSPKRHKCVQLQTIVHKLRRVALSPHLRAPTLTLPSFRLFNRRFLTPGAETPRDSLSDFVLSFLMRGLFGPCKRPKRHSLQRTNFTGLSLKHSQSFSGLQGIKSAEQRVQRKIRK